MPVIPSYEQKVGLDIQSMPDVKVDDSVGRSLVSVGGALTSFAEHVAAVTKAKNSFSAQIGADLLNVQMDQELTKAERNAPADGTGLTGEFIRKSLTPKTDEFLRSIADPELRSEYAQRMKVFHETWVNAAANREYGLSNKYSKTQIDNTWASRAASISQNPAAVNDYIKEMDGLIDKAPNLTPAEREEAKAKVRKDAPSFVSEALRQQDPEAFFYATGNGTEQERLSFLAKRLAPAVRLVENGPQDPRVVSARGAIGLMQVTLGAAEDVAKKIGDHGFLSLSPDQKIEFLKNGDNNVKYGTAYLGMMVERYKGDVEAALVAYNAGMGNADKWLAAGKDYSVLPKEKETGPYVQKVLASMGPARLVSGEAKGHQGGTVDPAFWASRYTGSRQMHANINPTFAGRLQAAITAAEAATGEKARIRSLARTNEEQQDAYRNYRMTGKGLAAAPAGMKMANGKVAPGSRHERGMAADIESGKVLDWLHQHAGEYGLEFLKGSAFARDPVHIQLAAGTKTTYDSASVSTAGTVMNPTGAVSSGLSSDAVQPPRSGFVSPVFQTLDAPSLLKAQGEAEKLRAKADTDQMAQTAADAALKAADAAGGNQAAAYDLLKQIPNADVRKSALAIADAEYQRRDRMMKDQQEKAAQDAYDAVIAAPDPATALKAITPDLPPATQEMLRGIAAKGPLRDDDVNTKMALTGLWVKDPAAFAKEDLSQYFGKLTPETIATMKGRQDELRKAEEARAKGDKAAADAGVMAKRATVDAAGRYIDNNLREIGVDLSQTASSRDIGYANTIRSMAVTELEKLQEKLGRPPLDSEIQDAIKPLFKAYPVQGYIYDSTGNMKDVVKAYQDAGFDPAEAQSALSKIGAPVTPQNLMMMLEERKKRMPQ